MSRSRAYIFTLNNYTDDEYQVVLSLYPDKVDYLVCGKEVGEKNGTPHLQGYLYNHNKLRFTTLTKLLPRARFAVAKGTAEENHTYCTKDGECVEFGERPQQGKRNDMETVRELIRSTGSLAKVAELATSFQSLRSAEVMIKYMEPKRDFKPDVVWIWGDSGSGKTRLAYEMAPNAYRKSNQTGIWWDGYDAHENVILDDIKDDSQHGYSIMLELLDRYETRVQVKGGTRQFLAKKIIITSIWHPEEMFRKYLGAAELLRRIDTIIGMNETTIVRKK